LTDFGLASETTASQLHDTTSARGSDGYRSPELASDYKFSTKVDIWTMGCLLYELAVGRRAFCNDYAVLQYCERNEPFLICLDSFRDETAKPVISGAISRMLQKDPSQRPTAAALYDEFSSHCRMESPKADSRFTFVESQEVQIASPITVDGKFGTWLDF
jgi:serine/threonine protein kinase